MSSGAIHNECGAIAFWIATTEKDEKIFYCNKCKVYFKNGEKIERPDV
jgi:hypothetical protein